METGVLKWKFCLACVCLVECTIDLSKVHTNLSDVSDSAAETLLQHHWGEVLADYLCQYADSSPLLIKPNMVVSSAYLMMSCVLLGSILILDY